MPRRRAKPKPRATWVSSRRPAPRRGRTLVRLGIVAVVLAGIGLLHLQVSLARRFEGRLWQLPSRIYSDTLTLAVGDRVPPSRLAARLDRSGYARTGGAAARPGQYVLDGSLLEVHTRPFHAAAIEEPSRRLRLRFRGDRIRSITDGRDRPVDRAGLEPELLATLFGPRQEERILVRLDQVPRTVTHAVLAAEDARYFAHHGLDLKGIVRAAVTNLRNLSIVQGGSTITQQTVKNLFLGQERTWWRKGREGVMSVLLDARYSKERILEVYLNEVYLGQRGPVAICGVQAASRFYFGRDLSDLSLAEAALLAGLIRSPGRYNPFVHAEAALTRRNVVLHAMQRLGHATPAEVKAALAEPLHLASGSGGFSSAPYAVDFVQSQLAELYSPEILRREGLRIYTTIDTLWQEHAETALREGLARLEKNARRQHDGPLQGVVLVTNPDNGAILAMVGGRDYTESQFNRAVQARRQPGSCFKPFVYAAGFERAIEGDPNGLTTASELDDSPLVMTSGGQRWTPENYDHTFRGRVSVRRALEQSLNVPTVRAAQRVGLDNVVAVARRMGIVSPLPALPSIALGAVEVSPLELASAYGTLARLGRHGPVWIVRAVVDQHERVLARSAVEWTRAIGPEAAYLVNDVLQGVMTLGTGQSSRSLGYRGGAAGKTGTTDDTRDSWFVGYTSDLLALVWIGYDDNAETGLTGASGALPIWVDLMQRGGAGSREADFAVPAGIVERRIDPRTGGLAQRGCPSWRDELFAEGTEPTVACVEHGSRFQRWFRRLRRR